MKENKKLKEFRNAINKECTIKKHSHVMEITFRDEDDANWFENIFEHLQKESAVCCLMPIRPENAPSKFIFNVKDIDKLIKLIKNDNSILNGI